MSGNISIGINNIATIPKKIYIGNANGIAKEASAIYVGDSNNIARKVWPQNDFIYQYVDYIVPYAQGAYINTNIIPTENTIVFVYFTLVSATSTNFFGSESNSSTQFGTSFSTRKPIVYFASTYTSLTAISINTKYLLSFNNYTINYTHDFNIGSATRTISSTFGTSTKPLILFGYNKDKPTYTKNVKIHSFKILEKNVLLRNYYPCYRTTDGEIGMYDEVSKTFFPNEGISYFIKGSDIANPQ